MSDRILCVVHYSGDWRGGVRSPDSSIGGRLLQAYILRERPTHKIAS